jgi:predicted transcriptional regulator
MEMMAMDNKVIRYATPNTVTRIEIIDGETCYYVYCNGLYVHSFAKGDNEAMALDHANRMVGGMVMMIEFQIRTAE